MSIDNQSHPDNKPDYANEDHLPYIDRPYFEFPQSQAPVPAQPGQIAPSEQGSWGGQPLPPAGMPGAFPPVHPPHFPVPPGAAPSRPFPLWKLGSILLAVLLVVGTGTYFLLTLLYPRSSPPVTSQQTPPAETPAIPSTVDTSVFEAVDCPFQPGRGIKEGQDLRCGYITVPENHSEPNGTKIRLAIAIFESPDAESSSLPWLYLSGGPGGDSLESMGSSITASGLRNMTLDHDLILLDQRGIGHSEPALECGETERNNDYVEAMEDCRQRLVSSGVDPTMYTTIESAHDIHAIIQALGHEQINLYGVSYGTRLALTVMRLFPNDLRSVILDSTVPTQMNLFGSYADVTQNAYDTFFNGCSNASDCNSEHPQLEETFYQSVTTLNVNPGTFNDPEYGKVELDGDSFASWLFSALYVTFLIPSLPDIIAEVSKGDYTQLSQWYGPLMLSGGISVGMYYSVECGEDLSQMTLAELEATAQVLRPELQASMLESLRSSYAVCDIWQQPAVPAEQKLPVTSSIPTLVLSGEFDPITPPSNGEVAMETLSNAYFYTFPGMGHGIFLNDRCSDGIIQDFLEVPTSEPAGTCVTNMEIKFT